MSPEAYLYPVNPDAEPIPLSAEDVKRLDDQWNELFNEKMERRNLEQVRAGCAEQRAALADLEAEVMKRNPE